MWQAARRGEAGGSSGGAGPWGARVLLAPPAAGLCGDGGEVVLPALRFYQRKVCPGWVRVAPGEGAVRV